jgi:transcriptional regulator with XRE-family HTH domain
MSQQRQSGRADTVRGASIGERIESARLRSGLTKTEVGRAIGKGYRKVQSWITGEAAPSAENLRKLAEVLGVTVDELLGVAEGQDPPFGAWGAFLQTAEGQSLTPHERRALAGLPWAPGTQPTVASYHIALAAVRSAIPR